ncbi:MAG TPA: glycoside hydrolase family 16 protein [Acidimicrobiia bacterium]|nr:glycoside hydrolase family 16 protein [Acidimicrobiia bacterium]
MPASIRRSRAARWRVPLLAVPFLAAVPLPPSTGAAAPAAAPVRPMASSSTDTAWVLRFSDEFDGPGLDATKWSPGFGWGDTSGNTVGVCDPDQNSVEDGLLVQRIVRRGSGRRPFRVGCINSRGRHAQLFGYWEARIRAAGCRGSRSSFWAKPDDESWPPELDVVEVYGDDRSRADLTIHWWEDGEHEKSKGRHHGPDFWAGFHVFGAEWSPTEVVWHIDGVEVHRTRRGARHMDDGGPFYTMVEAQVVRASSLCGRWPYYSAQHVDYVRIWDRPAVRPVLGSGSRSGTRPAPRDRRAGSGRRPGVLWDGPARTGWIRP